MFELANKRMQFTQETDFSRFPTGKMEGYYEVIKEIASAIILCEGFKATGENAHKDLFDFLFSKNIINPRELSFLQDLRDRRNKSYYEGQQTNQSYILNNEQTLLIIISNLNKMIKEKLK